MGTVRGGALGGSAGGLGSRRWRVGGRPLCDLADAGRVWPLGGFLAELVLEFGEDVLVGRSIGFWLGRGCRLGLACLLDGRVVANTLKQLPELVVGRSGLCFFAGHVATCRLNRDSSE